MKQKNKPRQINTVEKLSGIRKFIYITVAAVLVIVIAALLVIMIIKKDDDFSETENRVLAQLPELTVDSLISGEFMEDAEDYTADQFAFRDSWITIKLYADMLLGKKEVNGVYLGSDNQLIEILDDPDKAEVDKNLLAIRTFSHNYAEDMNVYMALVPNSCLILSDKLPTGAQLHDENSDIDNAQEVAGSSVKFIDLRSTLADHADEYIFYKTDHHWTSLGAKYAFETIAPAMGLDLTENYQQFTVSDSFYGTLSSKTGYRLSADTVDIYVADSIYNKNLEYYVDYVDQEYRTVTIYDSSALSSLNKYEVFFGGNYSRIDIETTSSSNKNLLIIKDSYANSLVQFLLPYYDTICMVDPRYYYDDIYDLMEKENITDVLFLYNVNTFNGDRYIADMLEK